MGLTKDKKRGHHANIELDDNPEKNNLEKAYIRKEIRHDNKTNFESILNNYNLSERDKKKIIDFLNKKNK